MNSDNKLVENLASTNNVLPQVVDSLRQLYGIIVQNTYVKDTSKHLDRIIQDANNQTMILIVGKERVGKTTLVNGLLSRTILSVNDCNSTGVNTFLRYGEREEIKAYFLDGVMAIFDISKLELLTTGDTFASQILREHLDYLEVYINHELLKSVTIIDSVPLEVGNGEKAYFSESLINRVDGIYWILRNGSIAIDAEVKLLEALKSKGKEPLCVVNAIDIKHSEPEAFLTTEKSRIGHLMSDFVMVSAKNALESQRTKNEALWQESQYTRLIAHINRVAVNSEKKTSAILIRLLQWLERFRFEITTIPMREPFKSAVQNIESYMDDTQYEFSRYQRDLAIVAEYEQEYKQVSEVFSNVHTLYQLLQTISEYDYLQDDIVNTFFENTIAYQQMLREYRRMHSEYIREYAQLDAQHKKIHGKGIIKTIFGHPTQNGFFKEKVDKLNEQQEMCVTLFDEIHVAEVEISKEIYDIQNYLMDLLKNRLSQIELKVQELNNQCVKEKSQLQSYAAKLNEFTCLIEAQCYLRDTIEPILMDENLPLRDKDRMMLKETIHSICKIDLTNNGSLARNHMNNQNESKEILFDFDEKYPLHALALTDLDVKSNDIPAIPKKLDIQYGIES